MDVERTMQFILDQQASQQARHETEMAAIRQTMAEVVQTLSETTKVQLDQARVLVRVEEGQGHLTSAHQATEQALKELAAAQQVTERKLQTFIDTLGRGTNGH